MGWHVGAAYTLGDIKLFGGWENIKYESDLNGGGDADWERDAFYVGLKWNLASGYLGAQYIQALEANCGGALDDCVRVRQVPDLWNPERIEREQGAADDVHLLVVVEGRGW